MTVAFQGEPGAFSELAALRFFGSRTRTLSCSSFEEVFRAVAAGKEPPANYPGKS